MCIRDSTLLQIERHTLEPSIFMNAIVGYTRKATTEILGITVPVTPVHSRPCPKCGKGNVVIRAKTTRCDNTSCGLLVFRRFLNKELTDGHIEQLLSSGRTKLIKGIKWKNGNSFDAMLVFDSGYNVTLAFPDRGSAVRHNQRPDFLKCHNAICPININHNILSDMIMLSLYPI